MKPRADGARSLARVFEQLLVTMEANEGDVVRQNGPEQLHDFRVAVRRTRSVIRLARRHLPDDMVQMWEPEWAWLAGVTGNPRDLDVLLAQIEATSQSLPPETKAAVDEVVEHVEAMRADSQVELAKALAGDRYGTLKRGWRAAVLELRATSPAGDISATKLARDLTRRANKQVLRRLDAVSSDSAADKIHALRKRTKRARYAFELFPQASAKAGKVVKRSKRLQDELGEFQDSAVQRRLLVQLLEGGADLSKDARHAARLLIDSCEQRNARARRRLDAQLASYRSSIADM